MATKDILAAGWPRRPGRARRIRRPWRLGGLGGLGGSAAWVVSAASAAWAASAPLNSAPPRQGLITTRDGIVGPMGAAAAGADPDCVSPSKTPDNMERWEAWCRASVIDFELMSKLGFRTPDNSGDVDLAISTRHRIPEAAYKPLVTMQPPERDAVPATISSS